MHPFFTNKTPMKKQVIETLNDHCNLIDKLKYREDVLISKNITYHERPPKLTRCDSPSIIFLTEGGHITFRVNFQEITLIPPALFVLMPNVIFDYVNHSSNLNGRVIRISNQLISNCQIVTNYNFWEALSYRPYMAVNPQNMKLFNQYFELMYELAKETPTPLNDLIIKDIIQSFLNYFIHQYELNELKQERSYFKTRKEHICGEFIHLVQLFATQEHKLDFYADKIKLSKKYLANTIKQVTHRTAGDWIDKEIIQEAKIRLLDYSQTIQQISDELHFTNPSHFGTFFKRETKLSPIEYRAKMAGSYINHKGE